MPDWKKLFDKVEKVVDDALAKLDNEREDKEEKEITPPPIKKRQRYYAPAVPPDEWYPVPYEINTLMPAAVERAVESVLTRLADGNPVGADFRPMQITSTCSVCNQERTDSLFAGLKEGYLDYSGHFSEERFRASLRCRRCGMEFGASPEKLEEAKKQWTRLASTAACEADIDKNVAKETAEAYQRMYNFSTGDDE